MIQKLIEKLNKKRLKERISSAIVMVALIVSISGVVGAVSGIVVNNRYNYALKNYGFSQGDIGKMMITFADTRSYLRAAIGYQDENLVNSCVENYEKKKESCQQYTKEVKNTVSSSDEEKIYSSITEKLTEYYEICDAVLEKGKNTQDIDARHEAQQMAQDQVAPIYEQIYQDMVKLMDANTEHGDKLEKILTMVELITLIAIIAVIALAIFAARRIGRVLAQNIVDPLDQLGARFDTFAKGDLSFSKLLVYAVLYIDYKSTMTTLDLCRISVANNYTGSLPYLTALIAFLQAATATVLSFSLNKSKAENTTGGITYDTATKRDC